MPAGSGHRPGIRSAHWEVAIDGTREPFPLDTVVFIDRYGVRITGAWLDVPGARYSVGDFERVWTVRGPRSPVSVIALVVAVLVLVIGGIMATDSTSAGRRLVILLVLVLWLTATLSLLRAHPRPLILNALYQNHPSMILETTDLTFFNQICRALSRARQLNASRSQRPDERAGVLPGFDSGYRGGLLGVEGVLIGLALAGLVGIGIMVMINTVAGSAGLGQLPWP